jgi:hypothetical protein
MSDSSQPKKWRVKGKYGKKSVAVNVTTPIKERAEEYADFFLKERGPLPSQITETEEKTKKKKP